MSRQLREMLVFHRLTTANGPTCVDSLVKHLAVHFSSLRPVGACDDVVVDVDLLTLPIGRDDVRR